VEPAFLGYKLSSVALNLMPMGLSPEKVQPVACVKSNAILPHSCHTTFVMNAMTGAYLLNLYDDLNHEYFDGILPACQISWSRQLTRTAGNIDVRRQRIKLSVPLLLEAFHSDSLFGSEHIVCGVLCTDADEALREILKHEMIHLWLHVKCLPCGHTAEFRAKAKSIGQPRTRHNIALPPPTSGWIYSCGLCGDSFTRRRRYGKPVACAKCCKRHNGGKYHERYKLRGRRAAAS